MTRIFSDARDALAVATADGAGPLSAHSKPPTSDSALKSDEFRLMGNVAAG